MRKTLRRILASVLTAVMLLTAAPLSGFVGIDIDFGWLDFSPKASALSYSGSCGSKVTYTFDSDTGLLTISGTGAMRDYYYSSSPFYNNSFIKSVVINSGVTSIGDHAFVGCTGLTSATIGNSVENIDCDAFYGCTGLTSITVDSNNPVYDSRNNCKAIIETQTNTLIKGCRNTIIPDSVARIGDLAFDRCTGLTNVIIPDSVTSIGNSAFYGCTGLTSITIPDRVTSIGKYVFYGCTGLTSVTIPNSVTSIGDDAFHGCTGLTSITIPNSVTSIGSSAFYGCTGLTSVTIPDSVTSIGMSAFYNTGYYNNTKNWEDNVLYIGNHLIKANDEISGSYTIKSGTITIANSAFEFCTGLTNVIIGNSVTSIGSYAFSYCTGLTNVIIGNSVTSVGDYAFRGCTGLTNVIIGNSVKRICDHAFVGCTGLTSVTIPKSVMYISGCAFGYVTDDFYNTQKVPNFKIYCYSGTAGERYAIVCGFDYELIEPSTVTDKNSGVSLEFPAWAYNGDVTLKVKEVLSGSSFDIAEKISGKTHLKVFSIETYVNSESVQPNGEVTVKIPVPDGFNAEKCKLYYLNASSKNPEETAITIKDGYIVFKTNHFSDWAIVQLADLGDVNEDSRINSSDALLVLRHSTGLITLSDSKKLNADVTRDGKINSTDALKILQYSTGIITSF